MLPGSAAATNLINRRNAIVPHEIQGTLAQEIKGNVHLVRAMKSLNTLHDAPVARSRAANFSTLT